MTNDVTSWLTFLLLPHACLRTNRPADSADRSFANVVRQRIASYASLDCLSQMIDDIAAEKQPARRPKTAGSSANLDLDKLVASKLDDGDIKGAVRLAASDDSLAPHDAATLSQLSEKHPKAPHDRRPFIMLTPENLPIFSDQDILKCLLKFPRGSAGGITGLRPQHLVDATGFATGDAGQGLLCRVRQLVNRLFCGQSPPEGIRQVLFGANLTALNKKGGGLRPIAVGETIRRLVAKCACSAATKSVVERMGNIQLGCGVKGGIEAAVHACNIATSTGASNAILLKLDFSNAFNTLRRDSISDSLAQHAPQLLPFFRLAYQQHSILKFGASAITSEEGLQQGDPLAPLLFCVTLHESLASLNSRIKLGYLDDISLIDTPHVICDDLQRLIVSSKEIGLHLNPTKCEVTPLSHVAPSDSLAGVETLLPGARVVPLDTQEFLGSPIGINAIELHLSRHLESFMSLSNRLYSLDPHRAFFLLKNCFTMPKFLYTLRTSPTFLFPNLLSSIDDAIRSTLSNIVNVQLDDTQWQLATLPVASGGLGIGSASLLSSPAFLSSVSATSSLVESIISYATPHTYLHRGEAEWLEVSGAADLPPAHEQSKQKRWSSTIFAKQKDHLLSSASEVAVARVQGCSVKGAGDWLCCLPSQPLGLHLNASQLRIAICTRLGCPVSKQYICICGAAADEYGNHALSCNRSASRHSRHNQINTVVLRALRSAGVPSCLEPTGLSRNDGKRPDGMTVVPWECGKCLVWDATVSHRLAATYLPTARQRGPTVANLAEQRKRSKYSSLSEDYIFAPLAFESLGGIGDTTFNILRRIGKLVSSHTGDQKEFVYLRQRVAMAIQMGNAGCVLESLSRFTVDI